MGIPLLLLRLEGPLQSWGLRSRWDVRDTGEEPSKSGVIGLLGCAQGIPVGDRKLVRLDQQLRMGVRVERAGVRLTDFHTITGRLPQADGKTKGQETEPATIVSPRDYLMDAAFLVVLQAEEAVLTQCADALQNPRWPVYLGRKSCVPSRPVYDGIVYSYESILDALSHHPWEIGALSKVHRGSLAPRLRCVIETQDGASVRPDRTKSIPGRLYGQRYVEIRHVPTPGVVSHSS